VWAEEVEESFRALILFPKPTHFAIEGHTVSMNTDVKLTFEGVSSVHTQA